MTRSFDVLFDLCLNKRVNNREAGDLRLLRAHYDVIVMHVISLETYDMSLVCQVQRTFNRYDTGKDIKSLWPIDAIDTKPKNCAKCFSSVVLESNDFHFMNDLMFIVNIIL